MGFKSYQAFPQPNGSWNLERPEPLRFAGPQGLIAQWYRTHRLEAEGTWVVPAAEWLALAQGAEVTAASWIVFEQIDRGVLKFARLERISGQFGSQTRIMMQFRSLQRGGAVLPLVVVEPKNACEWGEELSIDGGDGSANCSWGWQTPKLGFSSVTAGGARALP